MRKELLIGVAALLLCSGCVQQTTSFTDIAPITRTEMELTEKSRRKSMLFSRYHEYTSDDYGVTYLFVRGNKAIYGYFFCIADKFYIEYEDKYYTKEGDILYCINGKEKVKVDSDVLQLKVPYFLETLLHNISKANLMEQKSNLEEYHTTAGADALLRNGTIKGKIKTDMSISYMKNYINISISEDGNNLDTEIGLMFGSPTAVDYTIVNNYIQDVISRPEITDDTSKEEGQDSGYDFEEDSQDSGYGEESQTN